MYDLSALAGHGDTPASTALAFRVAITEFEEALAATRDRWLVPVAEGRWSPAQQAEHVLKANTGFSKIIYLLGSDRALPELPRVPGVLRDGRPVSPPNFEPGDGQPWEAMEAQWREANERLVREIERIDPANARTFWHPYFGDLDALGWARSTVFHTRHHRRQLGLPG